MNVVVVRIISTGGGCFTIPSRSGRRRQGYLVLIIAIIDQSVDYMVRTG